MNVRVLAQDWNRAVAWCGRLKALPGIGISVQRSYRGTTVSLESDATEWDHPFKITARWVDKAWRFRVAPGFVNGEPPVVPGTATPKKKTDEKDPPDLSLLEIDWLKMNQFVELGKDGENPVPEFLKALGVKNTFLPPGVIGAGGAINAAQLEEIAKPGKAAVKFDVFLSKARAQLVSEPQIVDGSGVTGEIFQAAIRYDTTALDRLGLTPRLLQAPNMPRDSAVNNALLRILGIEPDVPEDRLLVGTVYLVAPDRISNKPNENWKPLVRQNVFWNLCHSPRIETPRVTPPPIRFFSGLVGGLGDALINQNLAVLNELSNLVSSFSDEASRNYNSVQVGGKYWTA
jgi:hypothetical protein